MENNSSFDRGIAGRSSSEEVSLCIPKNGREEKNIISLQKENIVALNNFQGQVKHHSPAYHILYGNQHYIIEPPHGNPGTSKDSVLFPQCKGLLPSRYALSERLKNSKKLAKYFLPTMHLNYVSKEVNLNSDFGNAIETDVNLPMDINVHKTICNSSGSTKVCEQFKGGTVKNTSQYHSNVGTQPNLIPTFKCSYLGSSQNTKTDLNNDEGQNLGVKTLKRSSLSRLSISKSRCIENTSQKLEKEGSSGDSQNRPCFQSLSKKVSTNNLGSFLAQLEEKKLKEDKSKQHASSSSCLLPITMDKTDHHQKDRSTSLPKEVTTNNNVKKINLEQYRARRTNSSEQGRLNSEADKSRNKSITISAFEKLSPQNEIKGSPVVSEVKSVLKAPNKTLGTHFSFGEDNTNKNLVSCSNLGTTDTTQTSSFFSRSPRTSPPLQERNKGNDSSNHNVSKNLTSPNNEAKPSVTELSSDAVLKAINKKLAELDAKFEQKHQAAREKHELGNITSRRDPVKDSLLAKKTFYGTDSYEKSLVNESRRASFIDEPVILTLSSGEEDEDDRKVDTTPQRPTLHSGRSCERDPILFGGGSLDSTKTSSDTESEKDGDVVTLWARTIWVGNYRVMPKEKIKLKRGCFSFVLPTLVEGDNPATIILKSRGIVQILAHLKDELPVFFLYLKPSAAVYVRRLLKMTNEQGLYFNPSSKNEKLKRITIVTEPIRLEYLLSIDDYFSNIANFEGRTFNQMEYISQEIASEIICKSAPPVESQVVMNKSSKRRESETLFIYPPPPTKGGITVMTDDYYCLEEEQFLNDVILDFYLKWLTLNKVTPGDLERIHVFSTFFYKRLTTKQKKGRRSHSTEDTALTPPQKRHARVRSWTKDVDIFSKDFIFIPINEHKHWFLAVICYPGLDGPVDMHTGKPVLLPEKVKEPPKPKTRIELSYLDDEGSDRDEAEGDSEEFDQPDDDTPPSKKPRPDYDHKNQAQQLEAVASETSNSSSLIAERKEDSSRPIKQPCILIFDSLPGRSRSCIVATLREYLSVEYLERKGVNKIFSKDTMKGACPKVPLQTNFSDCGLFTLQFAQSFIEHPLKDFRFPLPNMSDWFNQDVVACKRESIAKLIQSLMSQYKSNHSIVLPFIHFNSLRGKSPSHAAVENIPEEKYSLPSLIKESGHPHSSIDIPQVPHLSSASLSSSSDEERPSSSYSDSSREPKRVKVTTVPTPRPKTPTPLSTVIRSPLVSDTDFRNHSDVKEKHLASSSSSADDRQKAKFGLSPSPNSAFRSLESKFVDREVLRRKKLKKLNGAKDSDQQDITNDPDSLVSSVIKRCPIDKFLSKSFRTPSLHNNNNKSFKFDR